MITFEQVFGERVGITAISLNKSFSKTALIDNFLQCRLLVNTTKISRLALVQPNITDNQSTSNSS